MRAFRSAICLAAALCVAGPLAAHAQTAPRAPQKTTPAGKSKPAPTPAPGPTAALAPGDQPALLGQYADWGAYAATSAGHKVCYAIATPNGSSTVPPNRPRNPAYMFISVRPDEKVKNEVSVIIGYPFKPESAVNIEIGPTKFAMYTKNDGAWIQNAAEEARMVEAMRKGADVVVTGTSTRGTQSTDRYSLKGLSQALDRAARECR